jgi:hypothetical protein
MSFDEMYDELVHAEFLADAVNRAPRRGAHGPIRATFTATRLRSIALITSGGLAFAALGAFLGGLGGEFAVSPAAAHALTSSQRTMALSPNPGGAAFHAAATALSAAPGGSGPITAATGNGASGQSTSALGLPSSTGGTSPAAPVSSITSGASGSSTGGGSTGGSSSGGSTGGSSTGGSSSGSTGGGSTGSTSTDPTSTVTQIVSSTGLSGVTTDLSQTLNGVVGSVAVPGTDLSTVTDPLTGVVSGVTSGLLGGGL